MSSTPQPTPAPVEVFDTTLRDGLQVEGVSATVEDKLRIAEQLDYLGVHYIEGGWPGANPKDIEFFQRAQRELQLTTSTMVAFGSTRRPKGKVDDDATLRNLIEAGTVQNGLKLISIALACMTGDWRSILPTPAA